MLIWVEASAGKLAKSRLLNSEADSSFQWCQFIRNEDCGAAGSQDGRSLDKADSWGGEQDLSTDGFFQANVLNTPELSVTQKCVLKHEPGSDSRTQSSGVWRHIDPPLGGFVFWCIWFLFKLQTIPSLRFIIVLLRDDEPERVCVSMDQTVLLCLVNEVIKVFEQTLDDWQLQAEHQEVERPKSEELKAPQTLIHRKKDYKHGGAAIRTWAKGYMLITFPLDVVWTGSWMMKYLKSVPAWVGAVLAALICRNFQTWDRNKNTPVTSEFMNDDKLLLVFRNFVDA